MASETDTQKPDEINVANLTEDQMFWITLVSNLLNELVEQQIITPSQRGETRRYLTKKLENK